MQGNQNNMVTEKHTEKHNRLQYAQKNDMDLCIVIHSGIRITFSAYWFRIMFSCFFKNINMSVWWVPHLICNINLTAQVHYGKGICRKCLSTLISVQKKGCMCKCVVSLWKSFPVWVM